MAKRKISIPKRIAGVKIPKNLRKSSLLRALFGTSLGREIMANALTAGAAAAAAILVRDRDHLVEAGEKGAKMARVATEAVQSATTAAVDVVRDAAGSIVPEQPDKTGKRSGPDKNAARH